MAIRAEKTLRKTHQGTRYMVKHRVGGIVSPMVLMVSFPVTSRSSCHILCYCGTFLCMVGPSSSVWGIQGVQTIKTATGEAKKHVSWLSSWSYGIIGLKQIGPTFNPLSSQNGSIFGCFGTFRLGRPQTPRECGSKKAQTTHFSHPPGLVWFCW